MTALVPILKTRRLVLRGLRHEDAAAVASLIGDPKVSRWLASVPYPYPAEAAAAWIARSHDRWSAGGGATFAITARGTLVGAIGLRVVARHRHAELGFWLGARYWGKGLAVEAGSAVLAWGFAHHAVQRIYGQYYGDNHASGRVMEKLGMLREGVRRRHIKKGNRFLDAHQFGILRDELPVLER